MGVTRIREVEGGGATWGSQMPVTQHFGLGRADGAAHVTVRWPDGMTTEYDLPSVDRALRITRGAQPVAL